LRDARASVDDAASEGALQKLVREAQVDLAGILQPRERRWEFERKRRQLEVDVEGPLIVNNSDVALEAVLQGIGLAYLFDFKVQRFIDAGKLVRVLAPWSPPFAGFYLYHPSRKQIPPALRAFIDFFRYKPK
jgi:DNA-binding transcriptional LysR family regulator